MDDQVSGKKRKWDEPVRKGRIWVFARGKNIVREDFMRVFEVGADDELIIHKQMAAVRLKNSRMMRGDGYRVQRASSWDEAKRLVQRTFQNVDAGKTAAFRRAEAQRVSRQLRGAGAVPMDNPKDWHEPFELTTSAHNKFKHLLMDVYYASLDDLDMTDIKRVLKNHMNSEGVSRARLGIRARFVKDGQLKEHDVEVDTKTLSLWVWYPQSLARAYELKSASSITAFSSQARKFFDNSLQDFEGRESGLHFDGISQLSLDVRKYARIRGRGGRDFIDFPHTKSTLDPIGNNEKCFYYAVLAANLAPGLKDAKKDYTHQSAYDLTVFDELMDGEHSMDFYEAFFAKFPQYACRVWTWAGEISLFFDVDRSNPPNIIFDPAAEHYKAITNLNPFRERGHVCNICLQHFDKRTKHDCAPSSSKLQLFVEGREYVQEFKAWWQKSACEFFVIKHGFTAYFWSKYGHSRGTTFSTPSEFYAFI